MAAFGLDSMTLHKRQLDEVGLAVVAGGCLLGRPLYSPFLCLLICHDRGRPRLLSFLGRLIGACYKLKHWIVALNGCPANRPEESGPQESGLLVFDEMGSK